MKLYFAPLEGITGHIFRNAFHQAFSPKIDKYFSPFISPGVNQPLTPKELRDIHPDNNKGMCLVPQILANNADDFLLATKYISELGYDEVNLNLGCPSGTVVAKKKGSGLLGELDILDKMLDKIYENTNMKVSIKTRIGKESPEEFPEILDVLSKYPVYELIIHPRVRSEFYKGKPHMDSFEQAVDKDFASVGYNGDILTVEHFKDIEIKYPTIDSIMIGRGFLRNPSLANMIVDGGNPDMSAIKQFHDLLLEAYIEEMSGERPVLFKMKELWCYLIDMFADADKQAKKIRKCEKLAVYKEIAEEMFAR